MGTVPEWLAKVRAAHQAVMDAETAVMTAFPLQSKMLYLGIPVSVGGPGDRVGEVWVTMLVTPFWQKQVHCAGLERPPEAAESPATLPMPAADPPPRPPWKKPKEGKP
jgi:hypothetical protein